MDRRIEQKLLVLDAGAAAVMVVAFKEEGAERGEMKE